MSQLPLLYRDRCDYHGCDLPVCQRDHVLPTLVQYTKKYCQRHSDEIEGLFSNKDLPGIIAWKALAEGNAKK